MMWISRSMAVAVYAVYLVSALFLAPLAAADEIKVIATNAVKESFAELVPVFEKKTGHHVTTVWGGTVAITKRVSEGEVFDLVVIPDAKIDELIQKGKIKAGGRTDYVKSGIGVAIAPDASVPDISSGEALKRTLLSEPSIVLSFGPSSFYLLDLFEKMGISDALKPKIKRLASGLPVSDALAKGEGKIGFTQISEFVTAKGIKYLGPLPPDVQHYTVFSFGLHSAAPKPDAARSLVDFLTSPAADSVIRHAGQDPATKHK